MRNITTHQKNFLLEYFFKQGEFSGWENIGTKLIENGESIVAGTDCIWRGGIGNFIKVEIAEELIGCSKYIFDLENFLTSEWYREVREYYLVELKLERERLDKLVDAKRKEQYQILTLR